ncbi:helix-turn-helix transcriptional regulator [Paraburkholderia sp. J11-2]|uniref:helix-turn-helix transcriptional regulator n=1 Tax=Paraburkholderia sp. J11-2 TaxID=2805431 RepID=UPI002AB61326|nr:helix-turn-helix domain-containing protein [Paraburkholderia sp. J11-2]
MKISSRYKDAFKQARKSPEYWTERALLELTRQFVESMKKLGLTQKALAERLDKKPEAISRVFSGRHNVTVATASQIAHALDMHLEIRLEPNVSEDRKSVFSVTSDSDAFVPRDGVVVKSRRLTLIQGTNDTITTAPSFDVRKAA